MLAKWASIIGLVLTAAGILIGFYKPSVTAQWAGPETDVIERKLRIRVYIGTALVLIGTALQMYAEWPN